MKSSERHEDNSASDEKHVYQCKRFLWPYHPRDRQEKRDSQEHGKETREQASLDHYLYFWEMWRSSHLTEWRRKSKL